MLLLLSLGVSPHEARAQEEQESKQAHKDLSQLSMEELMSIKVDTVYGASKFQQKVTEAPSSITIITADEIQKYRYRTVSDLLQSVPGFYVTKDRNYSYVGVAGISRPTDYSTHLLTLIDGQGQRKLLGTLTVLNFRGQAQLAVNFRILPPQPIFPASGKSGTRL